MSLVMVKDKFQVTIPARLRQELDLKVGDMLEAVVDGDKIRAPAESRGGSGDDRRSIEPGPG